MKQKDEGTTVSRRELAASLRRAREQAGRRVAETASHLDCSADRVERIEAGLAVVRLAEVRSVLDFYGVSADQRDELIDAARQVRARAWWHRYADLIDESFETLLILESEAACLRTYQPNLVPGLLQTERYAWELMCTRADMSLDLVHRQAALRAQRRRVLDRSDSPGVAVLLEEAVLRRPVGASAVMREQYWHLAQLAGAPGVSIQILPFAAGPHRAMGSGFHIYEFTERACPVVELELLDRVHFVAETREAEHYTVAFAQAAARALDAEESRAMLTELAEER